MVAQMTTDMLCRSRTLQPAACRLLRELKFVPVLPEESDASVASLDRPS